MNSISKYLLAALLWCAADLCAAAQYQNGKFASYVTDNRRIAAEIRQDYDTLGADLRRMHGFVIEDLKLAKPAFERAADLYDQAAQAYESDDDKAGVRIRQEAEKANAARMVWRTRLWEWRRRQFEIAPTEREYRDRASWRPPTARDALDRWIVVRKTAAMAWGRLADATLPDADPALIESLKEQAYAAEARCEIANWESDWKQKREEIWKNKKVYTPALNDLFDRLEKAQQERVRIREADITRDQRIRQLEQEMRSLEKQCREAYETEEKALEKAKGSK